RLGMERQAVSVAVSVREDFLLGPSPPDEWIVRRHASVVADPHDLANVVVQSLRLHPKAVVLAAVAANPVAVADRHVKQRIGAEQDSPREVTSRLPRIGDENLLYVVEFVSVQTAVRNGQRESSDFSLHVGD